MNNSLLSSRLRYVPDPDCINVIRRDDTFYSRPVADQALSKTVTIDVIGLVKLITTSSHINVEDFSWINCREFSDLCAWISKICFDLSITSATFLGSSSRLTEVVFA